MSGFSFFHCVLCEQQQKNSSSNNNNKTNTERLAFWSFNVYLLGHCQFLKVTL